MQCPIARSLERVGEWWSILILRDAFHGLTRFDQFQESLGIAPNMLTRRLNALVEAGLLRTPPLQRAPAARRIRADRARPRLPAGAVGIARLGQQAFRPRGHERRDRRQPDRRGSRPGAGRSQERPPARRSRFPFGRRDPPPMRAPASATPVPPHRSRPFKRPTNRLPSADRRRRQAMETGDGYRRARTSGDRRPGEIGEIRAQDPGACRPRARPRARAASATAATGGPPAALSKAPTTPMSAATSPRCRRMSPASSPQILVADNQSRPRRSTADPPRSTRDYQAALEHAEAVVAERSGGARQSAREIHVATVDDPPGRGQSGRQDRARRPSPAPMRSATATLALTTFGTVQNARTDIRRSTQGGAAASPCRRRPGSPPPGSS